MLSCFVDKYVCAKIICFYIWFVWIAIWEIADNFAVRVITWKTIISWNLYFGATECRWEALGKLRLRLFAKIIVGSSITPFTTQRHPGSQECSFIGEKRGMAPFLPMPSEPQTTETNWKSPWENGIFKSCRSCYDRI